MDLDEDELEALVMYQVGALMTFAKAYNMEIEHVRPHGAMYRKAMEDIEVSRTIAKAIKKCSQWLVYYGVKGTKSGYCRRRRKYSGCPRSSSGKDLRRDG